MGNKSTPIMPSATGLSEGHKGKEVNYLQAYLHRYGYLRIPAMSSAAVHTSLEIKEFEEKFVPKANPGVFDEATVQALCYYQRFHGLHDTGALDEATVNMMDQPRCGVPDVPRARRPEFLTLGPKWNRTNLTYSFSNFGSSLQQTQVKTGIRKAFDHWQAVSPLRFTEGSAGSADILIGFFIGDHGDDVIFSDNNVLAHALPPSNGDVHFNDVKHWSIGPAGGHDFEMWATHELGHSLGLDHSDVSTAIMAPTLANQRGSVLDQDDISGMRFLYP